MEENTRAPQIREQDLERPGEEKFGVIESWAQLALGMGETVTSTSFGLAQDVRGEVKNRVDATLGWAEEIVRSGFRFARTVSDRSDKLVGESLSRSEYGVQILLRALRRTSHDVAGLTSSTLSGAVTGNGRQMRSPNAHLTASA